MKYEMTREAAEKAVIIEFITTLFVDNKLDHVTLKMMLAAVDQFVYEGTVS
jgi:hypothetical protein